MPDEMRTLTRTGTIINALGGTVKVAQLMGVNPSTVSYWRRTNKFPARSYLLLKEHLRDAGIQAPDRLWSVQQVA